MGYVEPLDLRLLHLVNLLVDALQREFIRSTEVLAARLFGYLAEHLLVNLDLHIHSIDLATSLVKYGIRGCAVATYTNGIDLYILLFGDIGNCQRSNLPSVIHTIGQKNYNLRLRVTLAQTIYSRSQAVTYRCTILYHATSQATE